jgi:hypothetical protein
MEQALGSLYRPDHPDPAVVLAPALVPLVAIAYLAVLRDRVRCFLVDLVHLFPVHSYRNRLVVWGLLVLDLASDRQVLLQDPQASSAPVMVAVDLAAEELLFPSVLVLEFL